ncbi:MAG: hypothetical protein DDT19_00027 [Syntrophomonadaceae bacterium]|nr:hypothetical protein [Bacillota bacterium]
MFLFGNKFNGSSPKVKNSIPFWRRVPFVMASGNYITLEDFSKMVFFKISGFGAEGIEEEIFNHETGVCANMLKNISARGVFIQFTVLIDKINKNEAKIKEKYIKNASNNPLTEAIADETLKMYTEKGALMSEIFCSLIVPLSPKISLEGKKRKFLNEEDVAKQARELADCEKVFINTFSSLGFTIEQYSGEEYLKTLFRCINPDEPVPDMKLSTYNLLPVRKRLFASDFFAEQNFLSNGKYKFAALVADILPSPASPLTGKKLLQNIKKFPLIYNIAILNEDIATVHKKLQSQRVFATIFSGKKTSAGIQNELKKQAIDDVKSASLDKDFRIVETFISFLVWGKTEGEVESRISDVKVAVTNSANGAGVFSEWLRKESAFIATMPGCAMRSFDMLCLPAQDVFSFVPLRGEYEGDKDNPVMIVGNRYNGVTAINPFSKKQTKWAGIIIGPTGSGKSFFTNGFVLHAMAYDPFVLIVDMATEPSYEPLTNMLGGNFSAMNEKNRINMFDLRLGEVMPRESKHSSITSMLNLMLSETDEEVMITAPLNKEEKALLDKVISRVYYRAHKESPRFVKAVKVTSDAHDAIFSDSEKKYDTFKEYTNYWLSRYFNEEKNPLFLRKAETAHCYSMPILTDFIQVLSTDAGILSSTSDRTLCEKFQKRLKLYASFEGAALFNGVTNFHVENDIYSFHLGQLKERKEWLALAFLILRDFGIRKAVYLTSEIPEIFAKETQFVLKKQTREKLFFYDEFHNVKNISVILDVLDRDARQQRTVGMATYLVTQDIKDVAESGKNFLQAAANKYFLRHMDPTNPSMQLINDVTNILGLNPEEQGLLKSLSFIPGKYSEVFMMNEDIGKGVGINYPIPITRWINTTHRSERFLRENIAKYIVEKGKTPRQAVSIAVRILANFYPEGTISEADINADAVLKKAESLGYF